MCTEMNEKSRKLFVAAQLCIVAGLLLPMFYHPVVQSTRNILHFVCGVLLGLSLSINLGMVWKNARQRRLNSGPRL